MSQIIKYQNQSQIVKHDHFSAIYNLSNHLLTLGVSISPEDIQFLFLYEYKKSQEYKFEMYKLNMPIPTIVNGKVIGAIVGAIVGIAVSILIPGLGIGVVVAALTGASIGWKIASALSPQAKKSNQELIQNSDGKKEQRAISNPGFDTTPQPAIIGGVIPMIFSDNVNVNGGIRVTGNLLHSAITNFSNSQYVYLLFSLGLGKVESINRNLLLVNDQLATQYTSDELTYGYSNGENNQASLTSWTIANGNNNGFLSREEYSQSIAVSNNANIGLTYICKPVAIFDYGTYKTFRVETDELFDLFTYTEQYRIYRNVDSLDTIKFRVTGKTRSSREIRVSYISLIPANIELTNFSAVDMIYRINEFKYTTSKKCDRVDLNMSFELWSRKDSDGSYSPLVSIFSLEVDDAPSAKIFYVINSRPGVIRRAISIYNLPYGFHTVRIFVKRWQGGSTAQKLNDNAAYKSYFFDWNVGGKDVKYLIENTGFVENTYAEINTYAASLLETQTGQSSSDLTITGKVTVINEKVSAGVLNQSALTNHPGLILFAVQLKSSDRLQNSLPTFSHFVEKGLVGKRLVAAGTATYGTNDLQLHCSYFPAISGWRFAIDNVFLNNSNVRVYVKLKNLRTGLVGIINNIEAYSYNNGYASAILSTDTPLLSRINDKFYIYLDYSLDTFPDVYVHTLINPIGGLGRIISDKFVDFESIIKAKLFIQNNGFIFNSVIDNTQSWNNWATTESVGQLLLCTRYGGKYGLLPEQYTEPVAIFTASNILENNFNESSVQSQKTNALEITYRAKEDTIFYNKTVVVMTTNAYNNLEPYYPESMSINSVSNEAQIIKVAKVALKSRRSQDRMVEFYTGIQGFSLREGDLIIVQYGLTERDAEVSGFCLDATTYFPTSSGGSQIITLSCPIKDSYDQTYGLSVYHLKTGTIEKYKPFTVIPGNKIQVLNLVEEILPPSKGFSGDILIINKSNTDKLFRVSRIEPEAYKVKVQAIFWTNEILTDSDVIAVGVK